jgi:hypothetical protein
MTIASSPRHFEAQGILGLPPIPKWVWALLAVDVLMGVANVVTFAISRVFGLGPIYMFRLSNEANVPTWWSSALLLLTGVVLSAIAYCRFRRADRRTWALWLPAALFLFMSLDEVASIHEHIGHTWGATTLRTGTWVVICVPIFLLALFFVVRATWSFLRGRTEVIRLLALGIVIFLGSSVGLELLTNVAPDQHPLANAINLAEEVGEMIGSTVMLWGAVAWAHSLGLRIRVERTIQKGYD